MAFTNLESLFLTVQDLNRMQLEFFDSFCEIFQDTFTVLQSTWRRKLKSIKECRKIYKEHKNRIN